MKKVRLMVTGFAIVAVVGSSLAFTAMKSQRRIFCQSEVNNQCTIPVDGKTTLNNGTSAIANPCDVDGATSFTKFGTTTTTLPCPLSTVNTKVYETSDVIVP